MTSKQNIDKRVLERFWNQRAEAADDPRSVTLDRQSRSSVAREVRLYQAWMLRQLAAEGVEPRRVIDLGSGNGDWTLVMAERADHVTAVDLTEGFLAHTRARLEARGAAERVTLIRATLPVVELPTDVDLVICGAVIQYLDDADADALLARARAALAPSGALYFRTTVAKQVERFERCDPSYQAMYRDRAWYEAALARAGLRITRAAVATDFVADELIRRSLGPVLGSALGPALAWPLRLVRRGYRARRATDVYVCVARPARAEPGTGAPSAH